jgi:hypothetical protein
MKASPLPVVGVADRQAAVKMSLPCHLMLFYLENYLLSPRKSTPTETL